MAKWILALAVVLMLAGLPDIAGAQVQESRARDQTSATPQVDVSKLPLNLARVQRRLRENVEREELDGTTIRFNIDVFGETPPIVLFTPENDLRFGQVPFSAPTHQEMLNIVTPQEFRSPIMNFSNLLDLFGGGSKKEKKK